MHLSQSPTAGSPPPTTFTVPPASASTTVLSTNCNSLPTQSQECHPHTHQQNRCIRTHSRSQQPHQPDHDWHRHHHLETDLYLFRSSRTELQHSRTDIHLRIRPYLPRSPLEILRATQRLHMIHSYKLNIKS